MTPTKDRRAIVHVAGPASIATQRCIHCHVALNTGNYADSRWQDGAVIANHGRGGWSRLYGQIDRTKYRPCK